ncbi:hypothetical protein AY610_08865 [Bacillus velezensis]|nr:hypothetical protein AY610_08865 [Bacillus velezensis]
MISIETLRKSFFDVTATRLAEAGMSERISADSVSAELLCHRRIGKSRAEKLYRYRRSGIRKNPGRMRRDFPF